MSGLQVPHGLHFWIQAKIAANTSITTEEQEKTEYNSLLGRKYDEYGLQHAVYYKLKDGTYALPDGATVTDVIDKTNDINTSYMDKYMQMEFIAAAQADPDLGNN